MNRRGGPKIKIDLNPKSTTTEPQGLFQNGCSGDDSTVLGAYNNLPANVREMSGSVDTGFGSISSGLEETSSNYMAPTMNPIISNMVGEAISQGYSNGVEMVSVGTDLYLTSRGVPPYSNSVHSLSSRKTQLVSCKKFA